MMVRALFCLTLALVTQTKGDDEVKSSQYVLQDPSVHGDLLFTDNVSFDANAKSNLDCARMCASTMNCTSFTYRRSAVTSCRGYTEIMTSNSSSTQATGARAYALEKGDVGPLVPEGYVHDALTGMTYRLYPERFTNISMAVAACEAAGESLIMLETEEKVQAMLRGGLMAERTAYFVGLERISNYTWYSNRTTYLQENIVWIRTGQHVGSASIKFFSLGWSLDENQVPCVACHKNKNAFMFSVLPCDAGISLTMIPSRFFCEIV